MKFNCAVIMQMVKQAEEAKFQDWDLPIGLSLQLTRMIDKIYQEHASIEKQRMKILKNHCLLDEQGNVVPDEEGNAQIEDMEGFSKEFKELLEQEVEVDIKPLKIDFEKLEEKGVVKKPSEISWLLPLVEWGEEEG